GPVRLRRPAVAGHRRRPRPGCRPGGGGQARPPVGAGPLQPPAALRPAGYRRRAGGHPGAQGNRPHRSGRLAGRHPVTLDPRGAALAHRQGTAGGGAAVNSHPNPGDVFSVALPRRPYPGLRPFDKDEWPIFFGRERMADEVVSQLIDKRLLVVHGDSGCGKSSLVRAAVLPRLEQESARSGLAWRTCTALPGEAPLWNLAVALAALDGGGDERAMAFRRALNFGAEGPAEVAALLRRDASDHLCILVDQFEELFDHARHHGPEEAQ